MEPSQIHYLPHSLLFYLLLLVLLTVAFVFVQVFLLSHAYLKLGIRPQYLFGLLLLSLLGSSVNIPVAQLPGEKVVAERYVTYYGVTYVIPEVRHWPGTIIAVNVGGALVPTLLSLYLVVKHRLFVRGLLGVAIVATVVHMMAQPVRGLGITVPTFIPPILAAGTGLLLSWRNPPPLAYVAGTLGTLIGADLLNLQHLEGLGAPVASIGGAGTFDGVFLTGILAVLLTWSPRSKPPVSSHPPRELEEGGLREEDEA